ncbi:MAG: glycosyltransferase family 2 protein [Candidatus Celaenobacter antarcticus]|nr:glycosyltransferase family 2 protein [Candidatus Celaenobacter antarcticus]
MITEPTTKSISVVIIAKNEADNMERVLKSVIWADEILVADSGSTDATARIAEDLGAHVLHLDWEGFGRTKHKAVMAAKYDWILSIDADEEVSEELKNKIMELKPALKEQNAYKIKRISWYLNRKIRWCGWQNDFPLRLFNRRTAGFNDKVVHESVKTKAKISLITEPIYHYTYPTLSDHLRKINFYTTLNVEEKYRKGRKYTLTGAILQGMWKFIAMYFLKQGFQDGKTGFLLCRNSAIGQYLKYLKLWEKRQHDRTP